MNLIENILDRKNSLFRVNYPYVNAPLESSLYTIEA